MKEQFLNLSGLEELVGYIKVCITQHKSIIPLASFSLFPKVGDENAIYIDTSTNTFYRWDSINSEYQALAKSDPVIIISEGTENGQITLSVNDVTQSATVHGLKSAAYTESSAYATSAQGAKADSAVQTVTISSGTNNGTVKLTVNGVTTDNIEVTGLGSAAFSDIETFALANHGHTKSEVGLNNVDNTADADKEVKYADSAGTVDWANVSGKPSSFTPASHTHDDRYYTETEIDSKLGGKADSKHGHAISDITNLQSSLDSKASNGHSHTVANITDFGTHVYDATTSRDANTFLAAPNGKDGVADFREITPSDLPNHSHTKAQITDFPTSMPASDVPSWAKAANKPSYNWGEIGNKPSTFTPSAHSHGDADITSISASKITGVIGIEHIPQGALERLVTVTDDTARFKLTSSDVQLGDTVKVKSTGLMYYVVDESKLSSETGYEPYTAGSATSVPWSGVTGKPSSYTPSAHNQEISTITGLQTALDGKATIAQGARADTAVQSVKIGTTEYKSGTTVTLPAYPTTLPASDVSAWAKATSKPTYTKSEVGLGNVDNTADANKEVKYAASAGAVAWDNVSGKPSTFTPASHSQAISTITGLQAALDEKFTTADMKAASSSAAGAHGLVPAPDKGQQGLYLRGDGVWATPTNTIYGDATTSSSGLMTAAMVTKLNGIATGANAYSHPGYTARSSGLYKVTVDGTGHVSAVSAVEKADITGLGIPASDTNTWRPLGTTADTACAGNDSRLSNARPASDVYAWAKASSKPSYTKAEVGLGNVDNTADSAKSVNYANSAGSASWLNTNSSLNYGASGLQYFNQSTSTTSGATKNANPTNDWYHIIRMNHANSDGYYVDLAFCFHSNTAAYRRIAGGTENSWIYLIDSANIGSQSVSYATTSGSCTGNAATASNASKVNGHTVNSDVPSGAKFTDTNTWRGIQNNLTSTSTSDSLSAAQGKILKGLVDDLSTAITQADIDAIFA